jgi:hypothetical protein
MPTTIEKLKENMEEYAKLGLHGAVGSVDATHIASDHNHQGDADLHTGFKLTHSSRSYNTTGNHDRKILFLTWGFPARYNDKTIVRYGVCCVKNP